MIGRLVWLLIDCMIGCLVGWSGYWLIGWLVDLLIAWLIGWLLVGWLIGWLVDVNEACSKGGMVRGYESRFCFGRGWVYLVDWLVGCLVG